MVRWLVIGCFLFGVLMFTGCSGKKPPEKLYPMMGVVVEIDHAKQWVTVDHDDIPGLMKAMRMKFTVGEPEVLKGVAVGDELICSLKITADGQYVLVQSPC